MSSRHTALALGASLLAASLLGAALLPDVVFAGRVLDAHGSPVGEARVSVAALRGTTTDVDGRYELTAPRPITRGADVTLTARRAGYELQRRTVRVAGDTVFCDLVLRVAPPPAAAPRGGAPTL